MEDSTGWLPHVAINGWFAGDVASGSGQYLEHLLSRLPKIANTVRWSLLIPARKDTVPERMAVSYPGIAVFAIGLPPLPENLGKLWWEQVAVPHAAQRLRAHELWIPYWAAPCWQPVPTVVTIHDLIPTLLPAYRGGMLQRLYTQLVSVTAKRAHAVLTVSHASKRDIVERLKLAPDRIFVVHHGPNQEQMPAVSEDDRALVRVRYRLPERFFLYLGGFDVRKNVPTVIAAYRRYLDRGGDPAVKLVIAGRTPTEDSAFFPDPQETAAKLDVARQVQFCGWVDEAHKPALYALATAFLFPSLYEGFGMMVLEAMQAGTPVVTSRR